jgi:hypothetical protein
MMMIISSDRFEILNKMLRDKKFNKILKQKSRNKKFKKIIK